MARRRRILNWAFVVSAVVMLAVYFANASWLAPDRSGQPFAVAHRGLGQPYDRAGLTGRTCTAARWLPGGHAYLENTLPAIRAAFELGAAIVEFDVQPTADGHFVAFHDAGLECRTEVSGTTRDYSLDALQRLDVGHGYTGDGGRSWPFRGRGVGLMPSLEEVLGAFPDGRFLIDLKGGTVEEARLLGERVASLQAARGGTLYVHGRPRNVEAVVSAAPTVKPVTRARLKACLARYFALGWSGHVPAACRDTLLTVPANVAPWLWGWPGRLLERMERAGTTVVLLGDYGGEGFSTPIDDPARLDDLPPGYDGGIWTDRVDLIAPAISPPRGSTGSAGRPGSPPRRGASPSDRRGTASHPPR